MSNKTYAQQIKDAYLEGWNNCVQAEQLRSQGRKGQRVQDYWEASDAKRISQASWPDISTELKKYISECIHMAIFEAMEGRIEGSKAYLANANRYLPKEHPVMVATQTAVDEILEVSLV